MRKAELGDIDTGKGTQTPATAMTQAAEIQKLKADFFAASRQKLAKKSI